MNRGGSADYYDHQLMKYSPKTASKRLNKNLVALTGKSLEPKPCCTQRSRV